MATSRASADGWARTKSFPPGIAPVPGHVLADRPPDVLERSGRSGEVDPGKVGMGQSNVTGGLSRRIDQIDDSRRQPGLVEDFHVELGGVVGLIGRLPDDGVPQQCGGAGKVSGDRREVERRDREDESFQRTILHPVPETGGGDRLVGVDLGHELRVVSQKVDELADGVDLRLEGVLRLAQHRHGVDARAIGAADQFGRFQEDGRAIFPRHVPPFLPCSQSRIDCPADVAFVPLVIAAENVLPLVRRAQLHQVPGLDPFAADPHRQFRRFGLQFLQCLLQSFPFCASGRVAENRFVGDGWRICN